MDDLEPADYTWKLVNTCNYEDELVDHRRKYDAEDCAMCLESFETTADMVKVFTYCGHVFHKQCWDSMITSINQQQQHSCFYKCPVCRQDTDLEAIYDEEPAQVPLIVDLE